MRTPRCQYPGCTRASHGLIGQNYCSAPHRFRHETELEITAYMRDGKRIGGSKDTQLLASVIADCIERGEHRA